MRRHNTPQDIDFVISSNRTTPNFRNALVILEQDSAFEDALALNALYDHVVFRRDLPWRACTDTDNGTEWEDSDTLEFMRYAAELWDIAFQPQAVDFAVQMMANTQRFCPIKDYFSRLQWDGIPRIATALHDFLGAEANAYTMEVSALFFRAIAARVYNTGCKFDHVIVLQGGQGIGKSSFLRIIGGDWYSDGIRKFDGKEAIEAVQGVLIGEIPELQGFSKAEVEEIKAFITRTEDRARPAYGRRVKSYPRRTILVGTTNADDYLRDATGNRRFFPITCTKPLDFKALEKVRDQLLAEAVARYQSDTNSPLTLQNPEAKIRAETAREKVSYSDPWESIVLPWLEGQIREDYWECEAGKPLPPRDGHAVHWKARDRVATLEIFTECLGLIAEKIGRLQQKRIADIMRRAGWERGTYRFGKRYGLAKGYMRQ